MCARVCVLVCLCVYVCVCICVCFLKLVGITKDVIRDSTFMFWIKDNDYACVVVYELLHMRISLTFDFRP